MAAACNSTSELDPLVGAWSSSPGSDMPDARYEFHPGGTFFVEDHADATPMTASGNYAATDTLLTLEGAIDNGNDYRLETTYYVNDESLYLWVFQPESDTQPIAGRWTGSMDLQVSGQNDIDFHGHVTFDLRDDGTTALQYMLTSSLAGDVDTLAMSGEGTYQQLTGGNYHLCYELAEDSGQGYRLEFHLTLIDGAVFLANGFSMTLDAE